MNNVTSWTGVPTVKWTPVLNKSSLTFGSHYKIIPTEGYLAWEYNPLRPANVRQLCGDMSPSYRQD